MNKILKNKYFIAEYIYCISILYEYLFVIPPFPNARSIVCRLFFNISFELT